jgi:serine/threonine protein kinase
MTSPVNFLRAQDAVQGMEYLHKNNYIHRDLALRKKQF